ncbi:hypothetical protein E2562_038109 [Oryza meyeriana var. granulata]|uniref:Uncharacterized protein n=1 Tax=Oryza meyeriana var. granulata TaxID=110450 RepID=A0A6G1EU97_9ORYZ|nr:hypothetical protein E2562_038109 [Oryza meyeriana var. granulata]
MEQIEALAEEIQPLLSEVRDSDLLKDVEIIAKGLADASGSMAHNGFSGSLTSPRFDLAVDMGHPFLNRTVDGFLKIGTVGACKVAADGTFDCLHRARRRAVSSLLLALTASSVFGSGARQAGASATKLGEKRRRLRSRSA